jgi:hypothetical protein
MQLDRTKAVVLTVGAAISLLLSCCAGLTAVTAIYSSGEGPSGTAIGFFFVPIGLAALVCGFVLLRRAKRIWKRAGPRAGN